MKQPVLFIGHGSPMNVISDNDWTRAISAYGKTLEKPDAIVMISAHWLTDGVKIHSSPHPKTIHDFRGFPRELHDVQYPALSNLEWVKKLKNLVPSAQITDDWGFDHGTWGVLHFLRPQADVPVIPISLNVRNRSADFFDLGKALKSLREQNVLIVGSGNIVHNLREIDFNTEAKTFSWAEDFDRLVKTLTEQNKVEELINVPTNEADLFHRAHPSSEHWAPYIACLGAADDVSNVKWIFEGLQNGSISMRSAEWT